MPGLQQTEWGKENIMNVSFAPSGHIRIVMCEYRNTSRPLQTKKICKGSLGKISPKCNFKMSLYYLPVFPDVGSMRVSPGLILPERSASSIILRPIRSFTEPPALKNSHFATGICKRKFVNTKDDEIRKTLPEPITYESRTSRLRTFPRD